MSILPLHTNMRSQFAVHATLTGPTTFTAPDRISTDSNPITAGYLVGQRIQVVGSTSNDGYRTIASVNTVDIFTTEQTIVNEGPTAGVSLDGVFIDPGGFERWPIQLVRSGGFSPISGFSVPYDGIGMSLTVNASTADAVFGVDEYDWYLSQRSDIPANQYMLFRRATDGATPSGPESFSGSARLVHTTLAETEFGIAAATNLTPSQMVSLFKDMAIYVRRKSDGAIQFSDLLQVQLSNTQA